MNPREMDLVYTLTGDHTHTHNAIISIYFHRQKPLIDTPPPHTVVVQYCQFGCHSMSLEEVFIFWQMSDVEDPG